MAQTDILKDANVTINGETIALKTLHETHSLQERNALYAGLPTELKAEADRFADLVAQIKYVIAEAEAQGITGNTKNVGKFLNDKLADITGLKPSVLLPFAESIGQGGGALVDIIKGASGSVTTSLKDLTNSLPTPEQAQAIGLAYGLSQQEYFQQTDAELGAAPWWETLWVAVGNYASNVMDALGGVFAENGWTNLWAAMTELPSWEDAKAQAALGGSREHATENLKRAGTIAERDVTGVVGLATNGGTFRNNKGGSSEIDDKGNVKPLEGSTDVVGNRLAEGAKNVNIATFGVGAAGVGLAAASVSAATEGVSKAYVTSAQKVADKAMGLSQNPGDLAETRWGKYQDLADSRKNSALGQFAETRAGDNPGVLRRIVRETAEVGTRFGLGAAAMTSTAATALVEGSLIETSRIAGGLGKVAPSKKLSDTLTGAAADIADTGEAITERTAGITSQRWISGKFMKGVGRILPYGGLGLAAVSTANVAGSIATKDADATARAVTELGFTATGTAVGAAIGGFFGGAIGGVFGFGVGAVPGGAGGMAVGGAIGGMVGSVGDWIWGDDVTQSTSQYLVANHGYHSAKQAQDVSRIAQQNQNVTEEELYKEIAARVAASRQAIAAAEQKNRLSFAMRSSNTKAGAAFAVEDTNFNTISSASPSAPSVDDIKQSMFGVPSADPNARMV